MVIPGIIQCVLHQSRSNSHTFHRYRNKGMKYIHPSILQVVLYKSHQAVSVVFETMALLIMLHIIFHSFSF